MSTREMYDTCTETGRMALIEAHAGPPVQGPAAPSEADCAIATAKTSEAMADPDVSLKGREKAAEAEAAVYSAAYHLGLDESEPEPPPELELEAGL